MTLRSCLRWKPTGKNFRTAGLRWVPTGKIFTPSTTMVDSEPPNSSNADITIQYESAQTLDISAGTSNLSAVGVMNPYVRWNEAATPSSKPEIRQLAIKDEYGFIQRISLTGFPAQSVGSSNTDVLDSPCLLVLITGMSQSRQHVITSLIHIESCKSPTKSLFDVGSSRISIFTVNT
ncbi:hypothetical protein Tco_0091492 [Tanacetum coccineum]